MPSSSASIQANNEEKLTVEREAKVEELRRQQEGRRSLPILSYVKCVVAAFLSVGLLGCGVFSKISVIAIAKRDANVNADKGRRFIMLVLVLMIPQFLAFVRTGWRSIWTKSCPWPTKTAILFCVLSSVLEVVGFAFFTMASLTSKLISSELIAIMNCVSLVPAFYFVLKSSRTNEESTPARKKLLMLGCGLFQLSGFGAVIWVANGRHAINYSILSLLLISIAWLPKMRKLQSRPQQNGTNAVDNNDIEEDEEVMRDHPSMSLRRRTARTKATMISEGLKLVLTPFSCYLVFRLCHHVESDALHKGFQYLSDERDSVFAYFLVNIFVSFVGYVIATLTCSMAIQKFSFALPITLITPVSFVIAIGCDLGVFPYCPIGEHKHNAKKEIIVASVVVCTAWLAQFLSTTYYIWRSQDSIMAKESQLFWVPSYNAVLLEQNLLLNRKNQITDEYFVDQNKLAKDSCIFICTTMYHEADYEMEQLLNSIRCIDLARQRSQRRIESHIWFDGAVKRDVLNSYVLQLISLVRKALHVRVDGCTKLETPYGVELRWRLPGGMHFHIHLKDNLKVKNKKRWSQVMYMSYVLDFKIKQMQVLEEDTYILTTDADVKFDADSVEALLDRLIRDPHVGAVCGRTHPLGHGPLVWYQMFDYAIGHWFQKVANHVLGSVLCCPGCFSVYRAKALRDVLPLYSTSADHAVDFLTKDMGEDRWLCTLLVQAGWRLEYCAAAENHTYCPDAFDEFYKQRRRWIPSTLANLGLLISEYRVTTSNNDTVSFLFILYQAANVFSTIVSPAVVILLVVGGLQYGWGWDPLAILILLILISLGYGLICLYTSQDFQLKTAKVLSLLFSVLMSAVVVGLAVQAVQNPRGKVEPSPTPATSLPYGPTRNPKPSHGTSHPGGQNLDDGVALLFNYATVSNSQRNAGPLKTQVYLGASTLSPKTPSSSTTKSSSTKDTNAFYKLAPSTWYLIGLIAIFTLAALCHPTEAMCLLHGIWFLLFLPSAFLFLLIYSICNLTDRSWGTRENKAKTDGGESLWKIIADKLVWLCRGCKDLPDAPEPVVEVVQPNDENGSTSESSESDYHTPETEADENKSSHDDSGTDGSQDNETHSSLPESSPTGRSSPVISPNLASKPMKSALKKAAHPRPASPGVFRFPGEKRTVHFPSSLPTFKSHMAVGDWLKGKMRQYVPNFESNGYDDTSFIAGMSDEDLRIIGIDIRGHRKKILNEIEQLPFVELDNNVPDHVDKWLSDLGLRDYWLNFQNNGYDNPKALEDLKVMNAADLEQVACDNLGIVKRGHYKKLTQAIRRLQYPSAMERKIREARNAINGVSSRPLKEDGDGIEFEFWTHLRELRLLPESKAFGKHSELAEKLEDLRNSVVLCLAVVNIIWIILIFTLAKKADLVVAYSNPLGLAFLVVFGGIVVIQFLTMLWHRVSTLLHFLARAPFRPGASGMKGWAFNDEDLIRPPSEEDFQRVRARRLRQSRRFRSRERLEDSEEEPLINGQISSQSYRAASPRPRNPCPV